MRKSIFEKLKMNTPNVGHDFNKIKDLLEYLDFYYHRSLADFFDEEFSSFGEIRKYFSSYNECISEIAPSLLKMRNYETDVYNKESVDEILSEFLDFCEVHYYLIVKTIKIKNSNFKIEVLVHLKDLIETSLQKLGYKFVEYNNEFGFLLVKSDIVSEIVAVASDSDTEKIIFEYLNYKNQNENNKESILHKFIDKLEINMDKDNEKLVHSIREFVQIIRHPEEKKIEPQYKWFFNDYILNMDKLFLLCLYVQLRIISKEILDDFKNNKSLISEK